MKKLNLLIFLVVACLNNLAQATEKETLQFAPKSEATQLHINFILGEISIVGHEEKTIKIVDNTTRHAKSKDEHWQALVNIIKNEKMTKIDGKKDNLPYSLTIYVPSKMKIMLNVVESKKLSIKGLNGGLEVKAGHAVLELENTKGAVLATVGRGEIQSWMSDFSKENIQSLTLGNGNINVNMNEAADVSIDIINHHGKLKSDFKTKPWPDTKTNKNNQNYNSIIKSETINNGTAKIMLSVYDGDIYLNRMKKQ